MLKENNRNVFNLIGLTSAGLSVSEYPQIRAALVERFKEIYGSDIDLSTTSADGIYLETLSLMFNNLLQTVRALYNELDIRSATGTYLDSLCALSGIYRKGATYSTAVLKVTNLGEQKIDVSTQNPISFLDQNGNEWKTNVPVGQLISLEPNVETVLTVKAVTPGPLHAPKDWINQTISSEYVFTIIQEDNAEAGSWEETDAQLRKRRNQSMSTKGISILEAMAGSLLNITGIDDVKIYNNDLTTSINANDGTTIAPHSIYVVLRKKKNIEIAQSIIGSTIYEKLTPGIGTSDFSQESITGIGNSYKYTQYVLGVPMDGDAFLQTIYWKEAKGLGTKQIEVNVKLKKKDYFASNGDNTAQLITNAIKTYLNNLGISESFTNIDLINVVNNTDPKFRGQKTYDCLGVDIQYNSSLTEEPILINSNIDDNITTYTAKDCYFDTNNMDLNDITETSNDVIIISIK